MNTFKKMGLSPELLHAIEDLGFTEPTPIQQKAIPLILNSATDYVVLAQTGTGKTAAFGLPILQLGDPDLPQLQTLVLCPTRELCLQISTEITRFSKYMPGNSVTAVYGGASIQEQIRSLKSKKQIVVGTPGRVLDLINRKVLDFSAIRWLVLDEADEMLNMGFKDDLDAILEKTPKEKQTLLFSATMPNEVTKIARTYMNSPEEISVGKRNSGADNVTHEYYMVQAKDRYAALKRVADMNPSIYGIVFCRTRIETKDVAEKLMHDGYNADALHGDLSQSQRDYVMSRFRMKNIQMLVATDVAARGLDVHDLTHIINYNLPDDPEVYVHRSGRTGRAGKNGIAVSLVHVKESGRIRELERITTKQFERKQVPGGREICEKQLINLVDKVKSTQVDEVNIEKYLPAIYEKLELLDREELIKHFISVEFNRFLEYYKDAPDLNLTSKNSKTSTYQKTEESFTRFHINLGSKQNLSASSLIALVNRSCQGKRIEFGKIEILRKFSFFEIEESRTKHLLADMNNALYDGIPVTIQVSEPSKFGNSNKEHAAAGGDRKRGDGKKKRVRKW